MNSTVFAAAKAFGPKGEHWIRYQQVDENGGMCLIGALRANRRTAPIDRARFRKYYRRALAKVQLPAMGMAEFNDGHHTYFEHIRGLLILMRQLASGQNPQPKIRRVRSQDVMLEGLAALSAIGRGKPFTVTKMEGGAKLKRISLEEALGSQAARGLIAALEAARAEARAKRQRGSA
jgi:hypothetical protein